MFAIEIAEIRTYLMVQWLRLCASTARVLGSSPGLGTKIPHAVWCGQKIRKFLKKLQRLQLIFKVHQNYFFKEKKREERKEGRKRKRGREREGKDGRKEGCFQGRKTTHVEFVHLPEIGLETLYFIPLTLIMPLKGWVCSHCPGSEQTTSSPGRSTEPSLRMLMG